MGTGPEEAPGTRSPDLGLDFRASPEYISISIHCIEIESVAGFKGPRGGRVHTCFEFSVFCFKNVGDSKEEASEDPVPVRFKRLVGWVELNVRFIVF